MHALIIGATGATGRALLDVVLHDAAFTQVSIFVRRPVALEHPKLAVHVIDFEQPHTWQDKVRGDALFSCLGTTLKDAGSQQAQWRIDYDYQYQFAQAARANGVPQLLLVSSAYASTTSKGFYTRMKGQLEQAITALGFASLSIFRPPSLIRPGTDRTGEKVALRLLNGLNRLGLLRAMQPMPVAELAQALTAAAKEAKAGTRVLEAAAIRQLARG
ncbi:MAG: NAD(P)H-binding protein [Pseudomonadota bacterium]|nr:NAD(P)H-binding protein [Pseudomonadota bacterium]